MEWSSGAYRDPMKKMIGGKNESDERGSEAGVEIAAVADAADDAGRDGVAKCVDDEELSGQRGGADLRGGRR